MIMKADTFLSELSKGAAVTSAARTESEVFAGGIKILRDMGLRPALLLLKDGILRVHTLGLDSVLVARATELIGAEIESIGLASKATKTHRRVICDHETVFVDDVLKLASEVVSPINTTVSSVIDLLGYEKLLLSPIVADDTTVGCVVVAMTAASESDHHVIKLLTWQMGTAVSRLRSTGGVAVAHLEAMSRLAGGVAHDFNNLLTVILSSGFLLQAEMEENSEQAEDIDTILGAAKSAAGLTRQLLDFARQRSRFHTTFDANERLLRLQGEIKPTLDDGVELEMKTASGEALIHADPGQFDQVVMSMVSNALDAMPNGGTLSLSLALGLDAAATNTVELEVQDTGMGMDAETQRRMFEPFYTTKRRCRGRGLGMATAYGIVSGLGGTIDVDSQLDEGTTIFVRFPFSDKSVSAERRPVEVTRGGRVLVIEDQSGVRRAVVRTLEAEGFQVEDYETGESGLEAYLSKPDSFTAIICDVQLPGESGTIVAERILEHDPDAHILLISGHLGRHGPDPSSKAATLPFLWKPFSPKELISTLSACIDESPS